MYIGYTNDLKERFKKHQNGEVASTKSRRPLDLIFYEAYKSKEDAKRRKDILRTAKGKSSLRIMSKDSLK